jgi:hypothetical protein
MIINQLNRIREITNRYAAEFFSARLPVNASPASHSIPLEVIANYFSGSLLGMLTWWLEDGMPYSPEQMTEMFRQMLFDGLRQVMPLEADYRL